MQLIINNIKCQIETIDFVRQLIEIKSENIALKELYKNYNKFNSISYQKNCPEFHFCNCEFEEFDYCELENKVEIFSTIHFEKALDVSDNFTLKRFTQIQ